MTIIDNPPKAIPRTRNAHGRMTQNVYHSTTNFLQITFGTLISVYLKADVHRIIFVLAKI